jgi:hypothetical protein
MESSSPSKQFSEFLSFFPKATLPLTIQHNDHHHFSKSNDPLPDFLLRDYVIPNLDFEVDEFTEYLPCLQFESTHGMNQLVIWTARLMHYSFYVMNFNPQGLFLDMAEIAGFYTYKDQIIQKMAHVDVDGNLFIVEGSINDHHQEVSPDKTKKWQLQILPDGLFQTSAINL